MEKTLSKRYTEKTSMVEKTLLQCISYPFNILGYQLVHGNYISEKFRKVEVVHGLLDLLFQHRSGIGQLEEIKFIEKFCNAFFYTYQVLNTGEYMEHVIKFYTKDLALLYIYKGNNING